MTQAGSQAEEDFDNWVVDQWIDINGGGRVTKDQLDELGSRIGVKRQNAVDGRTKTA